MTSTTQHLSSLQEAIEILKPKLEDYLVLKKITIHGENKFQCFAHNDNNPSMSYVPSSDKQIVHCFSCGFSGDIFNAASILDNLPSSGPDWVMETVPAVAHQLGYTLTLGEMTEEAKERARLTRLADDIANIVLNARYINTAYMESRNWNPKIDPVVTIGREELFHKLLERGWDSKFIELSGLLNSKYKSVFDTNRATFIIRDKQGRPVSFIGRALDDDKPKYIKSSLNDVLQKPVHLGGMDLAIKIARLRGLYIVEGPGDRQQLLRLGAYNTVFLNGCHLSATQLAEIRSLGISKVFLMLDWDEAGQKATEKILTQSLKENNIALNIFVVEKPKDANESVSDPDEYLRDKEDITAVNELVKTHAFDWLLARLPADLEATEICTRMIPIIAAEPMAIKREGLIKSLHQHTGISIQSITYDVNALKDNKMQERQERLLAEISKYQTAVQSDPDNLPALLISHEESISHIEKDYSKFLFGVDYQLNKYEAVLLQQEQSKELAGGEFQMKMFRYLQEILSNGQRWSSSSLFYFGGRENSGKTTVMTSIAADVVLTDPETTVIVHSTDDSYDKIIPRLTTIIARYIYGTPVLSIGQAASPYTRINTNDHWAYFNKVKNIIRDLMIQERLIIIDRNEGTTLSPLEKILKYTRTRYPSRKILIVQDNTHNLTDWPNLDQTSRMTRISDNQKALAERYHACFMATVEYRKNMPLDTTKIKLPVNDDIADARALKYRPDIIIHVYNDLNDRADAAEHYWTDPNEPEIPKPRLNLIFGKNKISSFKSGLKRSLCFDLDTESVTLKFVPYEQKKYEYLEKREVGVQIQNGKLVIPTSYKK